MKMISKTLICGLAFSALAGCGIESSMSKLVPKGVITPEGVSEKPTGVTAFNPRVDILFVIDNSGSMAPAQDNLSRNAYLFADAMSTVSILDYHIGVVTTDMDDRDYSGRLVGSPAYLEKTTPDFVRLLADRMKVGVDGSATEAMFAPIYAALSYPLETTANAGFYRQDAFLAVIFITDAKDQSKGLTPQQLLTFLRSKKVDPSKVLAYGVIRTQAEQSVCRSSEDLDGKLEEFLSIVANGDASQKNILSLCSPDYGLKLVEFAKDIIKRSAGTVRLNHLPDAKTIKVTYGTQVIPNDAYKGWVYQPSTNSILLAEGIDWVYQGPNTQLTVDYERIDLKDE